MLSRIFTVLGILSYIGMGYLIIVNPAIMAWKNVHPLAGIGYILLVSVCLYLEIYFRERYPNFPRG